MTNQKEKLSMITMFALMSNMEHEKEKQRLRNVIEEKKKKTNKVKKHKRKIAKASRRKNR